MRSCHASLRNPPYHPTSTCFDICTHTLSLTLVLLNETKGKSFLIVNLVLCCASSADKGRGVVATRRVRRGTLLMIDTAVAYAQGPVGGGIPESDVLSELYVVYVSQVTVYRVHREQRVFDLY